MIMFVRFVMTALLITGSSVQASDCVTIMSSQDPSQRSNGIRCKRVARNSNNGNLGFWRCCPEETE